MGLDLNNVKLVKDKYQIKNIFIDDKEIKGVTKFTYESVVDAVDVCNIEFMCNKVTVKEESQVTQKQKLWLIVYETELGSTIIYESFTNKETAEWRLRVAELNAEKYNWKHNYYLKECEVEL